MKITKNFITKMKDADIKQNYKKAVKAIFFTVLIYIVMHALSRAAHASILGIMGAPDDFNGLSGTAKYLGESYRDNYYLDAVEGSYINQGINFIANFFWEITVIVTYALILAFNLAFSMDISNLFSEVINSIMTSLKSNIFDTYVLLTISIGLIYILVSFMKKNTAQMFSRLGYMAVAIAIALMTTIYSAQIVSIITQTSKAIGANSIVSITSENDTEVNLAKISGNLWGTLVHQPWLELEAENKLSASQIEGLLKLSRDSEQREKSVKDIHEDDKSIFAEGAGQTRVVPALVMLLVNGLKMIIMLAIAILQVVFEIATILLVFFLVIVLLLSIVPSTGGARLLGIWAKQILSFQIGIVLTSLLLGFLIKIDELIATYLTGGTYGWFAITILQVCVYVGVIWQRERIFDILKTLQNSFAATLTIQKVQNATESVINAPGNLIRGIKDYKEDQNFQERRNRSIEDEPINDRPVLDGDKDNDDTLSNKVDDENYRSKYEPKEEAPELKIDYYDEYYKKRQINDEYDEHVGDKEHAGHEKMNKKVQKNNKMGNAIDLRQDLHQNGDEMNTEKSIKGLSKLRKIDDNKDFTDPNNALYNGDKITKLDRNKESHNEDKIEQERQPITELDNNKEFTNEGYEKKLYGKNRSEEERPTLNIANNKETDRSNYEKGIGDVIKQEIPKFKRANDVNREPITKDKISNIETYQGGAEVQKIDFDRKIVSNNVKENQRFEEVSKEQAKSIDTNIPKINSLNKINKVNDINDIHMINKDKNADNVNTHNKSDKDINVNKINTFNKINKDRNVNDISKINSKEKNAESIPIKENEKKVITNVDRANMFSSKTV